MIIRKGKAKDLDGIEAIYNDILSQEELGYCHIGWKRGIYPTRKVAEDALENGELYVLDIDGIVYGSAIINQKQVDVYKDGNWIQDVPDDKVLVIHTLTIAPSDAHKGYGVSFVKFFEILAETKKCMQLRLDTNETNTQARAMYKKLGYKEVGIVNCVFNELRNINLVLLEKSL